MKKEQGNIWECKTRFTFYLPKKDEEKLLNYAVSGEFKSFEEFDFFFETDTPNDDEIEAIKFIDDVLQPEDIGLVESVQRGMQTPAFNRGRYLVDPEESGLSEHAVHHFHGLVLEAYRGACKT